MLVLLAVAAVAAAGPAFGVGGFAFEVVGAQLGSLEAGLDGVADLSFLLGEGRHLGLLLLAFVGILAAAGFRGVALRVVPGFFRLFFYLGLEEIKRFIHVC